LGSAATAQVTVIAIRIISFFRSTSLGMSLIAPLKSPITTIIRELNISNLNLLKKGHTNFGMKHSKN